MISNMFYQIIKCLKFKIDKYQKLIFILSSLLIIFGIQYRPFPIYLYSQFYISYPKEPMKYVNKNYKDGDVVVVQRLWLPLAFFNRYLGNIPSEKVCGVLDDMFENENLYVPFIESQNLLQKDFDYVLASNLIFICRLLFPSVSIIIVFLRQKGFGLLPVQMKKKQKKL